MTQTPIYIGIDVGTTVLKAAAFDGRSGNVLAAVSVNLAVTVGGHGEREQSPRVLDRALSRSLRGIHQQLGARRRDIAGIGLAAQGGSGLIADRQTGKALTPLFLWNDSRASKYAAEIFKKAPVRFWRSLTHCDTPFSGPPRLAWLKEESPELFDESNIHVGAGEYLYFKLTGQWRQDVGNAIQNGCYSVRHQCLHQAPLALVGVPLSFVAPLREGHERHGLTAHSARVFDLPYGLPVAGPYMDHEACYLASWSPSASTLQCSLGTAWVGNFILADEMNGYSPLQIVIPAPFEEGHLVIQPTLTGNVTWDWALRQLLRSRGEAAYEEADRIFSQELMPRNGLLFLPWMNVPNPLIANAMGGGVFLGLNPNHQRSDMLRAVVSGMTCEIARVLKILKEVKKADRVVLLGGASQGAYFRALLAAHFAPLPVYSASEPDLAGARGAIWGFSQLAAKVHLVRVPAPNKKTIEKSREAFESYQIGFDRLYSTALLGGAYQLKPKRRNQ